MTINFRHVLPRRQDPRSPWSGKRITGIGLLVCCSFLFSGCMVSFTDPLPGSRHFAADSKLLGRWSGTDEQGNAGFIQFDKAGPAEIAVSVFGKDSNLGYKKPVFKLKTTKIGSFNYLVLKATDPEAHPDYTLTRYSVDKNKLKLWILDLEKVKAAIARGQLKGRTSGGPYAGAIIESPSSDLVRLLKDKHLNDLFVLLGEYEKGAR